MKIITKIVILNNDESKPPFLNEHGFSALIEKVGYFLLFDTGNSDIFIKNIELLNINPKDIKDIVISHGHYDHSGGLRFLLKKEDKYNVYLRKEIFKNKFRSDKFIGIEWEKLEEIFDFKLIEDIKYKIFNSIYAYGPAPLVNEYEEPDKEFQLIDNNGKRRDYFEEELNLIIDDEDGLILITGCAHRGIANIVKGVLDNFNKKIKVLLGGFHLYNSPIKKIEKIVNFFNEVQIEKVIPCHCTGDKAISVFKDKFKGEIINCCAGDIFKF